MKGFSLFKPKSRIIVNKDDYHNGVARVQCKDGHYNYVDTKEHFLFKSGFYKAEEFTGPCAIADGQLLKYDGQVLFNGSVSHLKGMESYFVVYKNSYQDQKCALVSPEGERLTEYEYSRIYVDRNGAITASYTKKKYSPLSLSAIDGESLWWCELDSNGKELTPRMSYDREWVNDSLCTCRIYNWNRFDPCSCLYNTKEKVIVRKSVRYIEETKQYLEEIGTPRKYGILNLDLKEVLPAQFDEVFPATRPHSRLPRILNHDCQKGPFKQTFYYIVKVNDNYGLYDIWGNCILEPMYRDIQSSNDSFFLIDSDKGILAYDVVDDRRIRVLIEHIINPPTEKNKLVFYSRRYELCKSEDGQVFFTMFKDSESGKLGIVDDRLRVLLPPEYEDVKYNSIGKTFTAICPDRTEVYTLTQLIQRWEVSKPKLRLNRFPEDVSEEEINRRVFDDEYSTILFVDTETNGLPKDYNVSASETDNWPRILQICWVITDSDGKTLKRRNYYIRPEGFELLPKIFNPHAIPEEILKKEGVPIKVVLEEFSRDISTADVVVGHNIRFDKSVIQAELVRAILPDAFEGKRCYCTMIGTKKLCGFVGKHGLKYPKLNELYRLIFHEDIEGAHDASNDVDATMKCFFWLSTPGVVDW